MSPQYLFEYWQTEQYLPDIKIIDSEDCSSFCDDIGKNEAGRIDFLKLWIEHSQPIHAVYYDITSISSYSTNISFIEWGYNRDSENLPQLNLGVVCNQQTGIPLYYNVFPGSIVDVTTIRNNIKFLHAFGMIDILLILDRGFFSTANVNEMNNPDNKIQFIQPLPLSLKKVKELIRQSKNSISNPSNAFKYIEEILYCKPFQINLGKSIFDGNMYYNEKAELDQKQHLLKALLEIDEKLKDKKFGGKKEAEAFIESNITIKLQHYYRWNKRSCMIEKKNKTIIQYFSHLGCYLMISNVENGMDKVQMLSYYRNKDMIEKIFDLVKNEMDGKRLRAHGDFTNNGRLFIKFIALILSGYINKVMCDNNLYKAFTMKELLLELRKIKIVKLYDTTPFITEISKRQRKIFEAFNIPLTKLHSY